MKSKKLLTFLVLFVTVITASIIFAESGSMWRKVPTDGLFYNTPGGRLTRIRLQPNQDIMCECFIFKGSIGCRCANTI